MEQELTNLLLCKNVHEVVRLLKLYANNEKDRRNLLRTLLVKNVFDLEKIKTSDSSSEVKILDVYLKNMGIELKDS